MSKIVLILGGGPNIGLNIARVFSSKGSYKTVIVSRNPKEELIKEADLSLQADFTDPKSIKRIFDEVKQKFGVPNVVVYNAAALTVTPDPLSVPLEKFNEDLNVVITSAYAAAHEAVEGFKTLPEATNKTFIYTGNILNRQIIPSLLAFGIGKSGAAHLIQSASEVHKKDGYRFYWADERTTEGGPKGNAIDGEAHGEFYYELATSEEPLTWDATFVAGKGYVDFNGKLE
ncbi:putative uncharacterized oxidoreductase protein [Botrytis fragariae]|uniref:Uncharacterized oxidoreductase protein n=1 Tax=Botrytis fragariae TaxID=1964551 RepID=A0A8H6AR87_9HELO|nr:putative uncharacterized oxidoreductase protein [Botrytis fragariae]KAF5872154.1 putative uncharacterized oxidoreductase protein [Botrytis fragariae]